MTENQVNFGLKNIDFKSIIKFGIIGLIISLILGVIFYNFALLTVNTPDFYLNTNSVFPELSFIVAVFITIIFISTRVENRNDAIIIGFIVGLFAAILQPYVIQLFLGMQNSLWFNYFIGNQIVLLVITGILAAYIGNTHLKKKI